MAGSDSIRKINIWLGAALVMAAHLSISSARAESGFRAQFREFQVEGRFEALAYLVKQNKKIIPGEVSALVKEAMSGDKSYDEKLELLGLAQSMAAMYKEWHGDGKPLSEVEPVLNEVIAREKERQAEIEKWARYEKLTGNSLMMPNRKGMDSRGVAPVIFPHWVHRIWFECRACHPGVFPMKREPVSHAEMLEGRKCGRCHDGATAFSAKEQCERCHIAGRPGEERLMSPAKADLEKFKSVAARLGSGFSASRLPIDRFGSVDWGELKKTKAYSPMKSLDKDVAAQTRDNVILFESTMAGINSVLFNHGTHSSETACSACHAEVFKDRLGANTVNMTVMASGGSCGYCHGKVAFRLAECGRCHERPQGEKTEGLLLRK